MTTGPAAHGKNDSPDRAIDARVAVGFDLADGAAPAWVQVMPSGIHEICASRERKPITLRVRIGPESATALQRALQHHLSASRQRPFFDFDHERKAAAAWPLEFAWRDDPEPGVYARVEWSAAGREAVAGKNYRAFSPSFFPSAADPAEISGAPLCMGALVNDPAFKAIRPIWAKAADSATLDSQRSRADAAQPTTLNALTPTTVMTPNELAAAQARIAELESKNAELEANAASTEATQALEAAAAEKGELAAKVETLNQEIAARNQRDARAIVASVAAVNPVFAKDAQAQETWVSKIVATPGDADLLRKAYPKPAVIEAARRIVRPSVDITRESMWDVICGYVNASTPREKGWFYHRNISDRIAKGEDVLGQIPVDANSLGTVANALVSQRVLELVTVKRPYIKGVTYDFSDEVVAKGDTVKTRYVTDLTSAVANFASSAATATTTDVTVTLDAHKEIYLTFTGTEAASTRRDLVGEQAEAMAAALGNSMVDALLGLVTEASFGTSNQTTQASGWDFSTITTICKGMNNAGIPDVGRFAWVTEDVAEALVNDQTLLEYVDKSVTRSAFSAWTNVKGFTNIWEVPTMPQTNNIVGFFASRSALIVTARIPRTGADLLNTSYAGTLTTVTDPVSGYSVLRNEWIEPSTLAANARLITLYGVDVGQAACGWTLQTS